MLSSEKTQYSYQLLSVILKINFEEEIFQEIPTESILILSEIFIDKLFKIKTNGFYTFDYNYKT